VAKAVDNNLPLDITAAAIVSVFDPQRGILDESLSHA
jgi:hypothetical protein